MKQEKYQTPGNLKKSFAKEKQSEIKIASNRERLLPVVNEIWKKLYDEFSESIEGKEHYAKLLPAELEIGGRNSKSHEITFRGQTYEWSDDGVEKLKRDVESAIEHIHEVEKKAWEALKSMDIKGLPVEHPHKPSMSSRLKIGDLSIDFGSPKASLAAYKWALENGAMSLEEFKIREAVKRGDSIENVLLGYGNSPDHMRQTPYYGDVLGGVRLGDKDSELHKLATELINQREKQKRSIEMENMKIRIRIYVKQSRTKGFEIITEGPFTEAINEAIKKVKAHGDPRRGYNIWITRLIDDQKEGPTINNRRFLDGGKSEDIVEYLKKFNKEDLL